MSGFWDLEDGGTAKETGTGYEVPGGGNFDPIPNGSSVLATIDSAKWDEKNERSFVSIQWSVLSPDEYKNRKVFQKLWVTDFDPNTTDPEKAKKKRDKARKMLAAIDANCGGQLAATNESPTDDTLASALNNKGAMVITLMVWELKDRDTGDMIFGNWVCAVNPSDKGIDLKPANPRHVSSPRPSSGGSSASTGGGRSAPRDLDDEIPF